jgi:hypothetical protein
MFGSLLGSAFAGPAAARSSSDGGTSGLRRLALSPWLAVRLATATALGGPIHGRRCSCRQAAEQQGGPPVDLETALARKIACFRQSDLSTADFGREHEIREQSIAC